MTCNVVVRVPKASVILCLQCPLCSNLVHEATTICECLHTFCRDCIYQHLEDEENDCCPICNVNLGCSPIEKLRADHQLDDVRGKLFPIRLKKKRKVIDCDGPAPIRPKERSLLSLGVGTAPSQQNPGFASRKTKAVSWRSATATNIETTSKPHEHDEKQAKKKSSTFEFERDDSQDVKNVQESHSLDSHLQTDWEANQEGFAHAKREPTSEDKIHAHESKPFGSNDPSRLQGLPSSEFALSNSRVYHANRLKAHAIDQKAFDVKPISMEHQRSESMSKSQCTLVHLADLAVGQAVENLEPPKPCSHRRARRTRGKYQMNEAPVLEEVCANERAQSQHKVMSLTKPSVGGKLVNVNKRAVIPPHGRISVINSQHDKHTTGFWFILQTADNQIGNTTLPQIATRYLRIKDGKLPVSIVKKYIVKKLGLRNENEVEITCRGQPVVPNLPLESVRAIWFSAMPSSLALKEASTGASFDKKKWAHLQGHVKADDYLMVLNYARHR